MEILGAIWIAVLLLIAVMILGGDRQTSGQILKKYQRQSPERQKL